jgi:murein L,D-transpeptidase YcbB/YkuD
MLRKSSLAACLGLAAALAFACGSAAAQSAPDNAKNELFPESTPAKPAAEAPAAAAPSPAPEEVVAPEPGGGTAKAAETKAPEPVEEIAPAPIEGTAKATESPAPAPAADAVPKAPPAAETAAAPAPVEPDPVLMLVRQQLAASKLPDSTVHERTAMTEFYANRKAPVWVTAEGFTARAKNAMAEIRAADDWGLDAKAFALPTLEPGNPAPAALAGAEIKLSVAVLKYARYARGGRLEPSQISRNFDQKPTLRDPKVVLETVAGLETPGSYLRALHPKHPQFELLRQALLKVRAGEAAAEKAAETIIRLPAKGPVLKLGVDDADVALLRQRLKVPAAPGDEQRFDEAVRDAVIAFQRTKGMKPDGIVAARTRAALNNVETSRPVFGTEEQRLIVNMERWRWLPEDLGEFYVWDNIPEFLTRIVKNGRVIHQAKIVVGKADTQTTLFSASMRYVVFGPEWGVPDSIKVKELLPYLRQTDGGGLFGFGGGVTDTSILEKHNLRVSYNGRPVDPSQIDFSQVDIRKYTFIQPSGPDNALGAVKFRFPNKHDIYMHDTPQRELFNRTVRAFSHGCMRVYNPGKFAEIILGEDKGWSAAKVKELMARGGNNEVTLTKPIPVHITYFTMVASEDGTVHSFGDVYGHDRRVLAALSGHVMPIEPPSVGDVAAEDFSPSRKEASHRGRRYDAKQEDAFSGLFGN